MRTGSLIYAAALGAALTGPSPSLAQSDDPTPLSGVEVVAQKPEPTPLSGVEVVVKKKEEPTPLSGIEVVVKKKEATPLSGVDVVARRATPVSEVTVALPPCPTADTSPDDDIPPPQVVSTFPARGAVVRPGLLVLRVTFDRPMTCVGMLNLSFPLPDPCPAPLREPMISHDRRTFLTVCFIKKDKRYGLQLDRFTSLGGRAPPPYQLVFQTSGERAVATVGEAIAQDAWLQDPKS